VVGAAAPLEEVGLGSRPGTIRMRKVMTLSVLNCGYRREGENRACAL
jgi:hypothetical protein